MNMTPLPRGEHRGAKGEGVHTRGYNDRWKELVGNLGGPKNLSAKQVLGIDQIVRQEFGLPPR